MLRCSTTRRVRTLGHLMVAFYIVLATGAVGDTCRAATWERYPWVSVAGGYETDRIIEQGTDRFVVPAGPFVDIRPGILLSYPFDGTIRLNLDGELTFEQFGNDEGRSLLAAALNAELRQRLGSIWRWRLTVGANYFGDSVQETTDRVRAGAEAAFGMTGRRGFLELLAGGQGRRYPNLVTLDNAAATQTYSEIGGSLGVTGTFRPLMRLEFSGLVSVEGTDANDPLYDATALLAQAAVRFRVAGPLQIFASVLGQDRELIHRASGEDRDTYRQIGAGVIYPLGDHLDITARYAFARYEDPLGISDDLHRVAVALTWWPGRRGVRSLPPRVPPATSMKTNESVVRAGEPHLFRVESPAATRVALVGDFNGWDPEAHAMRRLGNGWWEVEATLPAGSHQYAYWVDGVLVAPPEAEITVDDGFGGRNGLLFVAEESP